MAIFTADNFPPLINQKPAKIIAKAFPIAVKNAPHLRKGDNATVSALVPTYKFCYFPFPPLNLNHPQTTETALRYVVSDLLPKSLETCQS